GPENRRHQMGAARRRPLRFPGPGRPRALRVRAWLADAARSDVGRVSGEGRVTGPPGLQDLGRSVFYRRPPVPPRRPPRAVFGLAEVMRALSSVTISCAAFSRSSFALPSLAGLLR